MATKLGKSEFPAGTRPEDFSCFGPGATKDGDFSSCMLVDMGCFNQSGVDSNKFYHAAVVQHKPTQKWYAYFEWGRTGARNPQFQFVECSSKDEAQREMAKQCHEKNDKRGEWATVGGMKTLRAKAGKDCYLVRPQAKRSTGLPDARTIVQNEGAKAKPVAAVSTKKVVDTETMMLMRDLNMGVVSYTRSSMADSAIPTQGAIDEGRIVLGEAKKRLTHLGSKIDDQVNDTELKHLTSQLYGRIPKVKVLRAKAEEWILNANNIMAWEQDLDAFESALSAVDATEQNAYDPFSGLEVRVEFLPPTSKIGAFVREIAPGMTNNRNGYGRMQVRNVWKVEHFKAEDKFNGTMTEVGKVNSREKPLFQPKVRPDTDNKLYNDSNTAMLVHGSRSVNIGGILKGRLRLPKTLVGVTLTAAMFGDGIYFADDWQKSAHYTSLRQARWTSGGGSIPGRAAFIFLSDVILGNIHLATQSHGYTSAPRSYHSVMGKAETTHSKYGGALVNNEFIVYTPYQNQLRYLIEFDTKERW